MWVILPPLPARGERAGVWGVKGLKKVKNRSMLKRFTLVFIWAKGREYSNEA